MNYPKHHAIFEKDVFRITATEETLKKSHLIPKPAGQRTLLDFNNSKYKTRSQVIIDEYENPQLTQD